MTRLGPAGETPLGAAKGWEGVVFGPESTAGL
jgi:hypothetical protein